MRPAAHCLRRAIFAGLLGLAAQAVAADPPPIEAYGDLPAVEDGAISPSGQEIALIGIVQGERRLLFLDATMKLLNSMPVGDLKLRGLEWIGEDAVLLTTSRTETLGPGFTADKLEAFYSTMVPVSPNAKARLILSKDTSIISAIFGRYGIRDIDGRWKGYFGAIALGVSMDSGKFLQTTHPSLFEFDFGKQSQKKLAPPHRSMFGATGWSQPTALWRRRWTWIARPASGG